MRKLPPLRGLVAFEATARLGSMVLAAVELGITPSAVSHRIASLEAHFGQALFRRTASRLEPTPMGARFAARLGAGLDEIAAGCQAFGATPEPRPVAVHVATSLAAKWLRPRLGRFLAAHPEISLRIVDGSGLPSPAAGLDLAIVYALDAPRGALLLLPEMVRPLCSPALRQRLPQLAAAEDLLALPLLHTRTAVGWTEWCRHMGIRPPPPAQLRFDRSHMAIDAAAEGHGVVLESDLLTEAERREGRLIPALPGAGAAMASVGYALVLPDPAPSATTMHFIEWIRAEAAAPVANDGAA